jgi:hypothetical protein
MQELDMSRTDGNGFLHAVHAREYSAAAPEGVEVWKYGFPLGANQPTDDVHVRFAKWRGTFECARDRHVEVLRWPAANAVVVAAANAVYIVDPGIPEQFSGVVAPVEINGVTFDESAQHMFVADSVRIFAFSKDRLFRWISEPLDGYGARFCGCGGRVLAVELWQSDAEFDGEETVPSVIRLRTEDGTILRSRFRLARRNWLRSAAA